MGEKLQTNLEILLQQLENFLTTKTVVGEPIHIDNTILVPLVDVSFGVGAGAAAVSNMKNKNKNNEKVIDGMSDTGGGGLGAKITPTAVLVIQDGTTQLINIKKQDSISKLIDMVPGLISKVGAEFKNKDSKSKDPKKTNSDNNKDAEDYIKDKIQDSYHNMDDKK